jgi:hypothetical protein
MNPPKLPTSISVPLKTLAKHTNNDTLHGRPRDVSDMRDINEKVKLMLAATEALKRDERDNIPPSKTSSRLSKLMKHGGVLRKMSVALADRFHSKSKSRANLRDQDIHAADLNTATEAYGSSGQTPIASIEIRLNEGENLNKKKVQKMTGGHVPRKPLMQEGKSLRYAKPSEDPFSESAYTKRPPTEFESRLLEASSLDSDDSLVPSLPRHDPFKTEKVLDGNIDTMLPCAPLGSSTPRARRQRVSSAPESPTRMPKATLTAHSVDGSGRLTSRRSKQAVDNSILRETSINKAGAGSQRKNRPKLGYIPILATEDRKKHPSPNKSDLELLQMRFRQQFPDLLVEVPDEKDELGSSPILPFMEREHSGEEQC